MCAVVHRPCTPLSDAKRRGARSLLAGGWLYSCRDCVCQDEYVSYRIEHVERQRKFKPSIIHEISLCAWSARRRRSECVWLHACHIIAACARVFSPLSKIRQIIKIASAAARLLRLSLVRMLGDIPTRLTHNGKNVIRESRQRLASFGYTATADFMTLAEEKPPETLSLAHQSCAGPCTRAGAVND